MVNVNFTVRMRNEKHEMLEKKAEELGVKKTPFINRAIECFSNFDKSFLETISNLSKNFDMSESEILQRIVMGQLLDDEAYFEVYGYSKFDLQSMAMKQVDIQGNTKLIDFKKWEKNYYQEKLKEYSNKKKLEGLKKEKTNFNVFTGNKITG